jgi:hypothetical protein
MFCGAPDTKLTEVIRSSLDVVEAVPCNLTAVVDAAPKSPGVINLQKVAVPEMALVPDHTSAALVQAPLRATLLIVSPVRVPFKEIVHKRVADPIELSASAGTPPL